MQHCSRSNCCVMSLLAYSSWRLGRINWSLWTWMASWIVKSWCSPNCLWITTGSPSESQRTGVAVLAWIKALESLGILQLTLGSFRSLLVRNCRDFLKAWSAFNREKKQFGVYFQMPWVEVSWCFLATGMCNPDLTGFFRSMNLLVVITQAKIQGFLCFYTHTDYWWKKIKRRNMI